MIVILLAIIIILLLLIDLFYYPKSIRSQRISIDKYAGLSAKGLIVQQISNNNIYCSRGYCVYSSSDNGLTFTKLFKISTDLTSPRYLGNSNLFRYITKYFEFLELYILNSGTFIVFVDFKIYRSVDLGKTLVISKKMRKIDSKEVRSIMPFGVTEDNNGNVYYGEYSRNEKKEYINIYKSTDDGATWNIYYSFNKGCIRHIHSLEYDSFSGNIWFTTGDSDNESTIGYFNEQGQINIVFRGMQDYRCTKLLFFEKYIYWGMDSSRSQNYIYRYKRYNGNLEKICGVSGPIYYGMLLNNGTIIFETAVEGGIGEWDSKVSIWQEEKEEVKYGFKKIISLRKRNFTKRKANIRFPKWSKSDNLIFTCINTERFSNDTVIISNDTLK